MTVRVPTRRAAPRGSARRVSGDPDSRNACGLGPALERIFQRRRPLRSCCPGWAFCTAHVAPARVVSANVTRRDTSWPENRTCCRCSRRSRARSASPGPSRHDARDPALRHDRHSLFSFFSRHPPFSASKAAGMPMACSPWPEFTRARRRMHEPPMVADGTSRRPCRRRARVLWRPEARGHQPGGIQARELTRRIRVSDIA